MKKNICIGILGGGQLARMSALAAYRLGFNVVILEKEKNSPAGQITHKEFVGWIHSDSTLKKFASQCDVITLENEFVDYHKIEFLEALEKDVYPSSTTVALIQDKLLQKETLVLHSIPVPQFMKVDEETWDIVKSVLGSPFVLKSRKMGYDGYGNALISSKKIFDDERRRLALRHTALLAEEFVHFRKELAVMVVRSKSDITVYPVVETIQKDHICHTVLAPASISQKIVKRAKDIAVAAVEAVQGFGIFGIEMFLTDENNIVVNEMAPRPHNSGHYTIDACVTSQFENHLRAILGLPLGSVEMIYPAAVMVNLLGKKNSIEGLRNYISAMKEDALHLHIYNKELSRPGRKMGHITVVGKNVQAVRKKALAVERLIRL